MANNHGNNNITVAIPGHANWGVDWWYGLDNFQLDIVGFLAVLGEGSVLANAQVSALSRLFYLPRLLPAPQALIRTSRPTTLPPVTAKVTGVHSGNVKDHVHHVANILLGTPMPTFTVRCVEVRKKEQDYQPGLMDRFFRGRQKTNKSANTGPVVKAKATGPLSWVTLLGVFEALALLIASIVLGDGMSILATILLAGLSTVIGVSNKWSLKLPTRSPNHAPKGDVVIRYPNGSWLIVRCDEDVARELYFAPEEIDYELKSPTIYRLLSLIGTLMLMLGVIALANAKLELQFAWAFAFILINIGHWIAAALPSEMHWDLSCYDVKEQGVEGGPTNGNFTEALWKAILLTKNARWVKNGEAAPQTSVWDEWLIEAEERAKACHEFHFGQLHDTLWPGQGDTVIWSVPKDWDAKTAWNRLNEEHQAAETKQALASIEAA